MKRILGIMLFASLISIVAYASWSILQKIKSNKEVLTNLNKLPEFSIVNSDSLAIEVPQAKNLVIIIFNSSCQPCQEEAEEIRQHLKELSQSFVLWISSESLREIVSFSSKSQLNEQSNIVFAQMNVLQVEKIFGSAATPHTFVYDYNRQLAMEFKGLIKFERIKTFLEK